MSLTPTPSEIIEADAAAQPGRITPLDIPIPQRPAAVALLLERAPEVAEQGPYLEAFHELTYKVLEHIHLLLAKGQADDAIQLIAALRGKQDAMWMERVEAAQRLVAP